MFIHQTAEAYFVPSEYLKPDLYTASLLFRMKNGTIVQVNLFFDELSHAANFDDACIDNGFNTASGDMRVVGDIALSMHHVFSTTVYHDHGSPTFSFLRKSRGQIEADSIRAIYC